MNRITYSMIFLAGIALGVTLTRQYFKNKYEQVDQEETFSNNAPSNNDTDAPRITSIKREEDDISKYAKILHSAEYRDYSGIIKPKQKEEGETEKPYVITPSEFVENDDYEKISLTYYADRVLTDSDDDLIEDVDDTVGFESLNHFGEYEDDSVFVRNDRRKCDYEILLDQRFYRDVIKVNPHRMRRRNDQT